MLGTEIVTEVGMRMVTAGIVKLIMRNILVLCV